MTTWDDLVTVALLGTERRRPDLTGWPGDLGRAAAALDDEPPAVVLDAAALATAYRRAGTRPVRDLEPEEPAPPDDTPAVPRLAAHRLETLLDTGDRELLAEWLTAAAGEGLRAPHRHLAALLRAARRSPLPGNELATVLGPRGRWLATRNPAWTTLLTAEAPEPHPRAWDHGSTAERTAWLTASRRRSPAEGRAALERTWAEEPVRDRAAFLALLAEGLGPADEPLLERALDDRPPVRVAAIDLLARLPGSAYAGRMTERARWRLQVQRRGLGRGVRLAVAPAEPDPAAGRDGLEGVGTARALAAALGATPLAVWADRLGDPDRAVRTEIDEGWADVVHGGWAVAAARQRDPAWALALLRHGRVAPEVEAALLPVLSADDRTAVVAALLTGDPRPDQTRAGTLLGHCPGPWDATLWQALAAWVGAAAQQGRAWEPRPVLRLARYRLPPGAAGAVEAFAQRMPLDVVRLDLIALADTLTTRARMLEELR